MISSGSIQTPGRLQSFKQNESEVHATTDNARLRIRIFSASVFQVSISDQPFDDFSYSVCSAPQATKVSVADLPDKLVIKSASLELTILKDSTTLTFRNAAGQVLSEDEPGLATSWIGDQVTSYKKLQQGERFLGLGEKTGPLDRKGHGYQNWNTDAYAYHSGSDPLYCSMPFFIGLHHGVQYGIFFDNSHKTFFNFGASNNRFSSFSADAGEMNYYFIQGDSVAEILEHYTWLTGRIHLPPKWSIGYQQCRYSYYPDKEVLSLAKTFREKGIPADALVLDIHYMDKYKIFTWDPDKFSEPRKLIEGVKELGFEVVLMCDPGIKVEKGYEPYDDGLRNQVFVKYADGENYSGQVWPGWCHFPDFTNPMTRAWWGTKLSQYVDLGVEGYWNDMNEIATWGHMLPENLVFDLDGRGATSRRARNLYGFQMARSTYESTRAQMGGKRPFNLTRSGFAGVQRYAAVWTGDNVSYDEHMMLGVRIVNSLGLTGVAFSGYDVGGFVGEAGTKLFARWISIGALSPFFRGHSMINTKDSEPWSYGEEVEMISRNYIRFRYQLLPYVYSLFHEASQTGMPVQRSLALDYTHDARVYGQYQHQYLFGPFVMVVPAESSKEFVKAFFPPGEWYQLYTGSLIHGDQEIIVECPVHKLPVYIKAGAILPMQQPVQNSREMVTELKLHVYNGKTNTHFQFYEDDGATFAFEKGGHALRTIHFEPGSRRIRIDKQQGEYRSSLTTVSLVLHGFGDKKELRVNGQKHEIKKTVHSFFLPLEKYDPINEPESMGEEEVLISHFPYSLGDIDISWE